MSTDLTRVLKAPSNCTPGADGLRNVFERTYGDWYSRQHEIGRTRSFLCPVSAHFELVHCGYQFQPKPQLNGAQGEWTGSDDMPGEKKQKPKVKKSADEKKKTKAKRNAKLQAQFELLKHFQARGDPLTSALGRVIKGRGDYTVGRNIGSKVGGWIGEKLQGFISKIFGSGDYDIQAPSAGDVKTNSLIAGSSVPSFGNTAGGSTIMFHEFVRNIDMSTDFTVNTFWLDITDPNTFPWASRLARNYQQWRLKGCVFFIRSLSSNTAVAPTQGMGSIFGAIQYDVNADAPVNKSEILNSMFASSAKPSENQALPIECDPKMTIISPLKVLPAGSLRTDTQFYKMGILRIGTEGAANPYTDAAELHVAYELELLKPTTQGFGGPLYFLDLDVQAVNVPLNPLADTPSVRQPRVDTIGVFLESDRKAVTLPLTLEPETVYMVYYAVSGTALGTDLATYNIFGTGGMVAATVLFDQYADSFRSPNSATNTGSLGPSTIAFFQYDGSGTPTSPPRLIVSVDGGSAPVVADAGGVFMIQQVDSVLNSGLTLRKRGNYTRTQFVAYLGDCVSKRKNYDAPPEGMGRIVDWVEQLKKTDSWELGKPVPKCKSVFDMTIVEAFAELLPYSRGPTVYDDDYKAFMRRCSVDPKFCGDCGTALLECGSCSLCMSLPIVRKQLNGSKGTHTGTDDVTVRLDRDSLRVIRNRITALRIQLAQLQHRPDSAAEAAIRCELEHLMKLLEDQEFDIDNSCERLNGSNGSWTNADDVEHLFGDFERFVPNVIFQIFAAFCSLTDLHLPSDGAPDSAWGEPQLGVCQARMMLTRKLREHAASNLWQDRNKLKYHICGLVKWCHYGFEYDGPVRAHILDLFMLKIGGGSYHIDLENCYLTEALRGPISRASQGKFKASGRTIRPVHLIWGSLNSGAVLSQADINAAFSRNAGGRCTCRKRRSSCAHCTTLNGNNGSVTNTDDIRKLYDKKKVAAVIKRHDELKASGIKIPKAVQKARVVVGNGLRDNEVDWMRGVVMPDNRRNAERKTAVKPKPKLPPAEVDIANAFAKTAARPDGPCHSCGNFGHVSLNCPVLHGLRLERDVPLRELQGRPVEDVLRQLEPEAFNQGEGDDQRAVAEEAKGVTKDSADDHADIEVLESADDVAAALASKAEETRKTRRDEIVRNLHDKIATMFLTKNFDSAADRKLVMQSAVQLARKDKLYEYCSDPVGLVVKTFRKAIRHAYTVRLEMAKDLVKSNNYMRNDLSISHRQAVTLGLKGSYVCRTNLDLNYSYDLGDIDLLKHFETATIFQSCYFVLKGFKNALYNAGAVARLIFSMLSEKLLFYVLMELFTTVPVLNFVYKTQRSSPVLFDAFERFPLHFIALSLALTILMVVETQWVIKYSSDEPFDKILDVIFRMLVHTMEAVLMWGDGITGGDPESIVGPIFYYGAIIMNICHLCYNLKCVFIDKQPWRCLSVIDHLQMPWLPERLAATYEEVCLECEPMKVHPVQDDFSVKCGDPVCKSKVGIRQYWGVKHIIPTVFATCWHNEQLSMNGRVGKRLPMHLSEQTAKAVGTAWKSLFRSLEHTFVAAIPASPPPMDFLEWTSTFRPSRRDELRRVREDCQDMPQLNAKSFIKKEIALKDEFDIVYKDPRFIQGCPLELSAAVGPHLRVWTKAVRDNLQPSAFTEAEVRGGKHIFYTCGRSNEEIGRIYGESLKLIESMSNGDDVVILEDDQSRFDLHLTAGPFGFLKKIYQKSLKRNIAKLLNRGVSRGTSVLGTRYSIPYTMQSGWPDTSVGDTIVNAAMKTIIHGTGRCWISIICGDDSVTITTKSEINRLGGLDGIVAKYGSYGMEVEAKLTEDPLLAEFCSGRFYPVDGTYVLFPKPGRVLSKLLCDTTVRSADDTVAWMRSIATTFESFGVVDPLLRAAGMALRRQVGFGRELADEAWEHKQWFDGSVSACHHDVLTYYDKHYDFSEQQVQSCIDELARLTLGKLSDSSELHFIAMVDSA